MHNRIRRRTPDIRIPVRTGASVDDTSGVETRTWRMSGISVLVLALVAAGLAIMALRGGSFGSVPRLESSIAVWWILGLAVAFGSLPHRRPSRPALVAALGLLALAAWTTLGLAWTESMERTSTEAVRVLGYAGLVLLVACTFGSRDRRIVVGVLTAVGGGICLLALLARLAPELIASETSRAGFHRTRLDYPFNYWNALGCWAAMTLALALAFSAEAEARWMRAASLALASLAPVVVYLTYSRMALVGAALAAVAVIALSGRRWLAAFHAALVAASATAVVLVIRASPEIARGSGSAGRGTVAGAIVAVVALALATALLEPDERIGALRMPRRVLRRVLAGAAAVVLLAGAVVGPQLARRAWRSFERRTPITASDPSERLTSLGGNRRDLWAVALDLFEDHPLKGIGAGTFEFEWNQDPRRSSHIVDAHSLYLESFAELGLTGGLLVLAVLGSLLTAALRAPPRELDRPARAAAAGAGAAFLVFCVAAGVDWMWESTAVSAFGLTLGTVAAAGAGARVGRVRRPLRAGLTIVAAAAIVVQLPLFAAASAIRASQAAVRDGRFVDALGDATNAAESAGWAASGFLQRALVLEQVGRLGPAAVAAKRSTELEPTNWQLWLVLGRIQAEQGRVGPALASVARARALNPRSPLFQPGVARGLTGGATRLRDRSGSGGSP